MGFRDSHWDVSPFAGDCPGDAIGFIYLITNTLTGRRYLGKKWFVNANNSKKKKWQMYTGSCAPLNDDIEILGKSSFTFTILEWNNISKDDLSDREESLQWGWNVLDKAKRGLYVLTPNHLLPNEESAWYNAHIGGKDFCGVEKHSEASKKKMSEANLGKIVPQEVRDKISEANLGSKSSGFMGTIVATSIATGRQTRMIGRADIYKCGFLAPLVYWCVQGRRTVHKGHTFTREVL